MKKLLLIFLILIVIVSISGWFAFSPPSSEASEKVFVIQEGEGVKEISQYLKDQNFIKSKFVFESYVWFKNLQKKFQAGEHKLRQNMNFWEVAQTLTTAKGSEERDIKIIEGWNNREIAEYLENEGMINKDVFLETAKSYKLQVTSYKFLADRPRGVSLEGYLFPDTYRIYKEIPKEFLISKDAETALAEHIIKKMLNNFDQKLTPDLREEIARQGKTIFEIVTMASILEKEVRGYGDLTMASDIFWKRLEINMPLQSDASVNYVTGKKTVRPSTGDTQVDSPYNTYQYPGLPPGPISNPGIESIKAAIYPKANDYYYFLTTEGGEVIYSRTNDEHAANKAKYLK